MAASLEAAWAAAATFEASAAVAGVEAVTRLRAGADAAAVALLAAGASAAELARAVAARANWLLVDVAGWGLDCEAAWAGALAVPALRATLDCEGRN